MLAHAVSFTCHSFDHFHSHWWFLVCDGCQSPQQPAAEIKRHFLNLEQWGRSVAARSVIYIPRIYSSKRWCRAEWRANVANVELKHWTDYFFINVFFHLSLDLELLGATWCSEQLKCNLNSFLLASVTSVLIRIASASGITEERLCGAALCGAGRCREKINYQSHSCYCAFSTARGRIAHRLCHPHQVGPWNPLFEAPVFR